MSRRRLRIGLDGMNLALPRGTGVATYSRTLSQALTAMGHQVDVLYGMNIDRRMSSTLREVTFFDSLHTEPASRRPRPGTAAWWEDRRASLRGLEAVPIPMSGRVDARSFAARMPDFDRILNVPDLFRRAAAYFRRTRRFLTIRIPDAPAIMHWTYPVPIRVEGACNITTIHDVVPLRLPHTTLDNKAYHYRLLLETTRHAAAICTVSEASRADILSFFPECRARIFNTYQSFQPAAPLADDDTLHAEIDALFGLAPGGYYLFYGSLEPKKNIGRLIEAFLASRSRRRLVIVGAMAWKSEAELRFLERGVATSRIVCIDYLHQPTLLALIACARAVLFPSISEGFGLPVLEALSLGTPVVTSREGALPEVGGDAAIYADAYDVASIAAAINRIDADDALRALLAGRAHQQSQKFSMSAYAKRLDDLYDAVSAV